jgi:uncharacterized protein YqeY
MSTNNLINIAETLSQNLTDAVAAALKAQDTGIADVLNQFADANGEFALECREIEAMEKQAAEIISQALERRKHAQTRYSQQMRDIMRQGEMLKSGVTPRALMPGE